MAATAVLAVVHGSHEDTSTALGLRALTAKTLDLAVTVNLVVLEHSELGLLALVLDLLGGGVDLLLPLLATTTQAEHQVQSRLLLDVVVGEGAAILELLAGEDETLLVRGNALLVLDLGLDIVYPKLVSCSFYSFSLQLRRCFVECVRVVVRWRM